MEDSLFEKISKNKYQIITIFLISIFMIFFFLFDESLLIQSKRNSIQKKIEKEKTVTVVGYTNSFNKDSCFTIASALLYDYSVEIFTNKIKQLEDFQEKYWHVQVMNKLRSYKVFCDNRRYEKDDVVIFSDLSDVVFLRSSKKFFDLFQLLKKKTNKNMFISSYREMNPIGHEILKKCPLTRNR